MLPLSTGKLDKLLMWSVGDSTRRRASRQASGRSSSFGVFGECAAFRSGSYRGAGKRRLRRGSGAEPGGARGVV